MEIVMDELEYRLSKDGSCPNPKCGSRDRTETGTTTSCGAFGECDDIGKNQDLKNFVCNKCGYRFSAYK